MTDIDKGAKDIVFEIYDTEEPNAAHIRNQPRISFYKMGDIALNPAACKLLDLKPGNRIVFMKDKNSAADWYIFKSDTETGFVLRENNKAKGLKVYSTTVSQKIRATISVDRGKGSRKARYSFVIASNPIEDNVHAILTKDPNYNISRNL